MKESIYFSVQQYKPEGVPKFHILQNVISGVEPIDDGYRIYFHDGFTLDTDKLEYPKPGDRINLVCSGMKVHGVVPVDDSPISSPRKS